MSHFVRLVALLSIITNALAASDSSITSQVRVAYHGDTGMVVSWNTFDKLSNPTVIYGLSPTSMVQSASSNVSVTYPTSLTYNNHVWLAGLLPDTQYYYQPQNLLPNETVYGPYSFKTARPAGDHSPFSIAFVCDLGTMGPDGLSDIKNSKTDANEVLTPGEQNTIASLVSMIDTYDFVVHPGDLAYADYWLKEVLASYVNGTVADGPVIYERILNEFYDEMESISAFRPYMIGVGNHEADCDNGGTGSYNGSICVPGQNNFNGVRNHFRMPSDISEGVENFWYSFDYGLAHFVNFNTETDLGNGLLNDEQAPYFAGPFGSYPNEQIDWLKNDLASVDRCKTPWVIALGHRPWFTSGDNCANCSTAFAQLFETYNVDAVLQGHFHVYERNLPIFVNGTIDPAGYNNPVTPWYIVNGIAGHWGGMDTFTPPLNPWHAYGLSDADATYGWSRLHFYNATHLLHEFVASNNNSVIDSIVLHKAHPGAFASACSASTTSASSVSTAASSTTSKASASSASTTASSGTGAKTTSASTGSSTQYTTSTIYDTTTYTVTSCASTVTNCPVGKLTTEVIVVSTTVCPVTEAGTSNVAGHPTTGYLTASPVTSLANSPATSPTTSPVLNAATSASVPVKGSTTSPKNSAPISSGSPATAVPTVVKAGASKPTTALGLWLGLVLTMGAAMVLH